MNTPDIESSKQLDHIYPGYLDKTKLHIFQNKYKCSIHGLRQFKNGTICELCDRKK